MLAVDCKAFLGTKALVAFACEQQGERPLAPFLLARPPLGRPDSLDVSIVPPYRRLGARANRHQRLARQCAKYDKTFVCGLSTLANDDRERERANVPRFRRGRCLTEKVSILRLSIPRGSV